MLKMSVVLCILFFINISLFANDPIVGNTITYHKHIEMDEGRVGESYSFQLKWPETPLGFALKSGYQFPSGLSLDVQTGLVSGVPTVSGNFKIAVEATNSTLAQTWLANIYISPLTLSTYQQKIYTKDGPYKTNMERFTLDFGKTLPISRMTETSAFLVYPTTVKNGNVLAAGKFPVISLSHGNPFLGQNYAEFLQGIASHGFIVIAPDYRTSIMGITQVARERAELQRIATNWVLTQDKNSSSKFLNHVDRDNIGMMGHSVGGRAMQVNIFESGARAYLPIDIVSLLSNLNQWDDYLPIFNSEDGFPYLPIMHFQFEKSGFFFPAITTQGVSRGPRFQVTFKENVHEDIMNTSWSNDGTYFSSPAQSKVTTKIAIHYAVSFFLRYLKDDIEAGHMLYGSHTTNTPAEIGLNAATLYGARPSSSVKMIDDFQDGELALNNLGFPVTTNFASASVGVSLMFQDVDRAFARENMTWTTFNTLRIDSSKTEFLIERLGTAQDPFDTGKYSHIAFEVSQKLDSSLAMLYTFFVNTTWDSSSTVSSLKYLPIKIKITDKNGSTKIVNTKQFQPTNGFFSGFSTSIFVPLGAFNNINRNEITTIAFEINGSNNTYFDFDNIRLEKFPEINHLPVSIFTMSSTSSVASSVYSFDATQSYDPEGTSLIYEWDFGDGTIKTGASTEQHVYALAGFYYIKLKVTDQQGLLSTTVQTVSIISKTIPKFDVTVIDMPNSKKNFLYDLNEDNIAVGYYQNDSHLDIPFMWSADTGVVALKVVAGKSAKAMTINDNNVIAGWLIDADNKRVACLWTDKDTYQLIGSMGYWTIPRDINNSNMVVGYYKDSGGIQTEYRQPSIAFYWTQASGMVSLGNLGGIHTVATGVSESGVISGHGQLADRSWVAFEWTITNGFRIIKPVQQGDDFLQRSFLLGAKGDVKFGMSYDFEQGHKPIVKIGANQYLDLSGNHAAVLNASQDGNYVGFTSGIKGKRYGTLWQKNVGLVELDNQLYVSDDSVHISEISGINDNGVLIGSGDKGVKPLGFILTPHIEYSILASAGDNGSVTPTGEIAIDEGVDELFLFTPVIGYEVDDVVVDGVSQGSINNYTFNSVDSDHTLSVSFKLIPVPTYSVTYNGNTNTGGSLPVDANQYLNGATVTVKTNAGNLIKSGYSFTGWNTSSNGSSVNYAVGSTFAMGSANITLYAKWMVLPTYSVTYNGNTNTGGSLPIDASQYLNGATVTVKTNAGNLIKSGYSFIGWNTSSNGSGVNYAVGSTFTMGSANIALYAKWMVLPTYSVTYNGNINTGGSLPVDASQYLNGATVTVKTNAGNLIKSGYSFTGWNTSSNGSGVNYAVGSTFTMGSANIILYAKWSALPVYTIDASSSGNGTISPPGLTSHISGSEREFSMQPADGYEIDTVVIDGVSAGNVSSYIFSNIVKNYIITVTFKLKTYQIISSAGLNGSIDPVGSTSVNHGGSQHYLILPSSGYEINDVLVNGVSQGAISSFDFNVITKDHTIIASFKLKPVTHTVRASSGSNGSISPTGISMVGDGDDLSFVINSIAGYEVDTVLVDGINIGAQSIYTFNRISDDHTISVSFKASIVTHAIVSSASSNGSISPLGSIVVSEGDSQVFNFTPNAGYMIESILVDGVAVGNVSSYQFINVISGHRISVSFKISPITFTINASAGSNGSISPVGNSVVAKNAIQSFLISPDAGYKIRTILVDGSAVPNTEELFVFNNIISDHSIAVFFDLIPVVHRITSSAGVGGAISPVGDNILAANSSKIFKVNPEVGFLIDDVLVDGVSVGNVGTYQFKNIAADHTITVHFKKIEKIFTIFVVANPNGDASPKGNISVGEGDAFTVNFKAEPGYQISDVFVDGKSVGALDKYQFVNVVSGHKVEVLFDTSEVFHQIRSFSSGGGNVSPRGSTIVSDENNQKYIFSPDSGFKIEDVIVDGKSIGATSSYQFIKVEGDHEVEVVFSKKVFRSSKEMTSFSFNHFNKPVMGDIIDGDIFLTIPAGVELFAHVATFTHTGVDVKVKGVSQFSGISYLDYRSIVEIDVIAEDGTKKTYRVIANSNDLENSGEIEFQETKYSVSESIGELVIKVLRKNGSQGKASVKMQTFELSALSNIDYLENIITLTWEDGEDDTKEIKVKILSDSLIEEDESFLIKLTNFTGSHKGVVSQTEIVIRNNSNGSNGFVDGGDVKDSTNINGQKEANGNIDSGRGGCSYSNSLSSDTKMSSILFWLFFFSLTLRSLLFKNKSARNSREC